MPVVAALISPPPLRASLEVFMFSLVTQIYFF